MTHQNDFDETDLKWLDKFAKFHGIKGRRKAMNQLIRIHKAWHSETLVVVNKGWYDRMKKIDWKKSETMNPQLEDIKKALIESLGTDLSHVALIDGCIEQAFAAGEKSKEFELGKFQNARYWIKCGAKQAIKEFADDMENTDGFVPDSYGICCIKRKDWLTLKRRHGLE